MDQLNSTASPNQPFAPRHPCEPPLPPWFATRLDLSYPISRNRFPRRGGRPNFFLVACFPANRRDRSRRIDGKLSPSSGFASPGRTSLIAAKGAQKQAGGAGHADPTIGQANSPNCKF